MSIHSKVDAERSGEHPHNHVGIQLPAIELVAADVHVAWMAQKRARGIESQISGTGEELMVEYDLLSEDAKELDRATVRTVYAAINSLVVPASK